MRRGLVAMVAVLGGAAALGSVPAAQGARRCLDAGDWRTCVELKRYADNICIISRPTQKRVCYVIAHERRGYLNIARLERGIAAGILRQSDVRAKVVCPERVARRGDVFYCTAYADGRALRVRVRQRDARGTVYYQVRD